MYNEYDTFILAEPLTDTTIPVGTRGVVLMVLGGVPPSYEVEFPDGKGGNLGNDVSYTISARYMRPDGQTTSKE